MKRFFVITFACLGLIFSAAANGNEKSLTVESRANNLSDQMIRDLRLNNFQSNKIRQINMDVVAQMVAVETEFKGNQELIEQKCKSICAQRDEKLENILSTVQYSNYYGDRKMYTKFDKEFVASAGQSVNKETMANNANPERAGNAASVN